MVTEDFWFKLFASCLVVRGYKESLIYDLERGGSYPLPNEYLDVLKKIQQSELNDFKAISEYSSNEIDGFTKNFLDEELAFLTRQPNNFPEINFDWDSPYLITNAIIQIDLNSNYDLTKLIIQLNSLGCQAIQLRIETVVNIHKLEYYMSLFNNSRIRFVELLTPFNINISKDLYLELISNYPRLAALKIYKSKENLAVQHDDLFFCNKLFYISKGIDQINEKAKQENFRFNITSYSEAQKYNLGLNRKVCISKEGNIKNFLSHEKVYGNINKNKIIDVINKIEFQAIWFISNDLIEKCKDCQYRYCCSSNSEINKKDGCFHKTETCDFDPYKNKWNFK